MKPVNRINWFQLYSGSSVKWLSQQRDYAHAQLRGNIDGSVIALKLTGFYDVIKNIVMNAESELGLCTLFSRYPRYFLVPTHSLPMDM